MSELPMSEVLLALGWVLSFALGFLGGLHR